MFFGVQFIKIFQMLFNKKYCFKNLSFFPPPPHEKIVIRTESWVKNRDTNRIVGLVYRYSPSFNGNYNGVYWYVMDYIGGMLNPVGQMLKTHYKKEFCNVLLGKKKANGS